MSSYRFVTIFLFVIAWLLVTATHAHANSWPPMAVLLLDWPLPMTIFSYGIGLVMIILVESFTVAKRLHISTLKSLYLTTIANLFSMFIGLGLVFCLSTFPHFGYDPFYQVLYISIFLLFGFLSSQFWQRVGFKQLQWHPLVWAGVWFVLVVLEFYLIGLFNNISRGIFPDPRLPFYLNIFQLLITIAYFSVGFLLSVVSEGFYLGIKLPDASNDLLKTVIIMNMRSYAYVAFPLTILGLYFF